MFKKRVISLMIAVAAVLGLSLVGAPSAVAEPLPAGIAVQNSGYSSGGLMVCGENGGACVSLAPGQTITTQVGWRPGAIAIGQCWGVLFRVLKSGYTGAWASREGPGWIDLQNKVTPIQGDQYTMQVIIDYHC